MDGTIGGNNMKLEERGTLRILTPEVGHKLYCVSTNSYTTKVYLGVNDSIDNYKEVVDEDYVDIDMVTELKETQERVSLTEEVNAIQDEVLNISMLATDEINTEYSSLVDSILLAMDELYCMIEDITKGGNPIE